MKIVVVGSGLDAWMAVVSLERLAMAAEAAVECEDAGLEGFVFNRYQSFHQQLALLWNLCEILFARVATISFDVGLWCHWVALVPPIAALEVVALF